MQVDWTKGLSGKEKEARQKEIKSYRAAFETLTEILEEESSTPDYDCPSWAHKQADQNGYNRAIRKVIKLININGHTTGGT